MSSNQAGLSLRVDAARQIVELKNGNIPIWRAPISTSSFGLGEEPESHKTPRGKHRIAAKIGEGAAPGTRFVGRVPTGEVWTKDSPKTEEDLVLTRILWLEGVEPYNTGSKDRFIYFHGTNREDLIGTPASHGCIRLRNADIATLFERVEVGTPVEIVG